MRVIDIDDIYDPAKPNDRLLLGMKGNISEFELSAIRARMYEAARQEAQRGELRISYLPLRSFEPHARAASLHDC